MPRPSMVVMCAPSACRKGTRQELTRSPFEEDGAGAALAFAAAFFGAGEVEVLAEDVEEALDRGRGDGAGLAVYRAGEGDGVCGLPGLGHGWAMCHRSPMRR